MAHPIECDVRVLMQTFGPFGSCISSFLPQFLRTEHVVTLNSAGIPLHSFCCGQPAANLQLTCDLLVIDPD